jgi:2-polyprenyl-6-methoxyphenol hydroxylase-like FAD-dependent oxidoreductase
VSPSCEEIQDLVDQRAPRRVVVSDPGWMAGLRCQLRSVTTYRRGRVLLAGDAAHIHSPAGGQGMNTGMTDANNLAWKLALVAGGAPDGLLDTYGQERRPVASNVLRPPRRRPARTQARRTGPGPRCGHGRRTFSPVPRARR